MALNRQASVLTSCPMQRRRKLSASNVLGVALILLLLGLSFRGADLHAIGRSLGNLGPLKVAVLLSLQPLAWCAETYGWRSVFVILGPQVRFSSLLNIRIGTEAITIAAPAGALVADSLRIPLLMRGLDISAAHALAGTCARKYALLVSQSCYTLFAAWLGFEALRIASSALLKGSQQLPWVVVAAGAMIALGAIMLRALLSRGNAAFGVRAALSKLRFERVQKFLRESERVFADTDGALLRFFAQPRAEFAIHFWFWLGWLIEGIETWLVLRCLGANVTLAEALAMDAAVVFLRNVIVIVPAGLGVQDAGYALFLRALGVPAAVELAAALALLKRGKELLWVLLGLWLLSARPYEPRAATQP